MSKASELFQLLQLLGGELQLFHVFPDSFGVGGMNQAVDVFADNNQIFVFIRSAQVPGQLMMTMDVTNIEHFPGYGTFAKLGAVQ